MQDHMTSYFTGEKLYGDDFSPEQIEEWFNDEKEAYAGLGSGTGGAYRYVYHQLNIRHGYSHLAKRRFSSVLGIGSAYGHEFEPIIHRIDALTILDPSDAFSITSEVGGVPCKYCKPDVQGVMPFADDTFDLITCLGVLHHIPNVSTVMKESYRVLATGGSMLLREPIVSMGDWRKPRPGITKRERGIPERVLGGIIMQSGFVVRHRALCCFPLLRRIASRMGITVYNSKLAVLADHALCNLTQWNTTYHRTTIASKFGPASAYFVLEKN